MANGDDTPLDPSGLNPVGSTTAFGGTAQNANDPLIDWASNLQKDDLAKFLHDPQQMASEFAARGLPPPPMDSVHAVNDQMGTPSRSSRLPFYPPPGQAQPPGMAFAAPAPPPGEQGPEYKPPLPATKVTPPPVPVDPNTGELKPSGPLAPVARAIKKGIEEGKDTPPTAKESIQGAFAPFRINPPGVVTPDQAVATPAPGTPTPRPRPEEAPAQAAPAAGMPTPRARPKEAGEALDPQQEQAKKTEDLGDTISKLGRAMQGVKAPEPLHPPNIGAPSVRGPLAAGAPNLTQLLAHGIQSGQIPPSIMPVLKLLGRV
jgi:hypothetical protein